MEHCELCKHEIPSNVPAFMRKNMVLCNACYTKLTTRKYKPTDTTPFGTATIEGSKMSFSWGKKPRF